MVVFEILAFENHELYDGNVITQNNIFSQKDVVTEFVKFYKKYFMSYINVPREYISFNIGQFYISYIDKWSGDKPIMLMLLGNLDKTLIEEIQLEVQKAYSSTSLPNES